MESAREILDGYAAACHDARELIGAAAGLRDAVARRWQGVFDRCARPGESADPMGLRLATLPEGLGREGRVAGELGARLRQLRTDVDAATRLVAREA